MSAVSHLRGLEETACFMDARNTPFHIVRLAPIQNWSLQQQREYATWKNKKASVTFCQASVFYA